MNKEKVVATIRQFCKGFFMALNGLIGGIIAFGSVILMGIVAVGLFIEMVFGEFIRITIHNKRLKSQIRNSYKKYHPPKGWKNSARRFGL